MPATILCIMLYYYVRMYINAIGGLNRPVHFMSICLPFLATVVYMSIYKLYLTPCNGY